jgi:3-carboxy-cis,cis-muconate cycloisomerase
MDSEHPTPQQQPRGYTAHFTIDVGLLSPVRAGTPGEAETSDTAWLQAMLDAESALVRAQARLGTVPARAAAAITEAARAERLDLRQIALSARETANPVVGLVTAFTALVAAEDPQAAEYVHRGSTSQDILDTGAMLITRRVLALIRADLRVGAAALKNLSEEHRDSPMAGRTLALQAVPTTFGLKAAGWRQSVLEAEERLGRLATPVSLGGAAGTLAGYLEYANLDDPSGTTRQEPGRYVEQLTALFAEETGLEVAGLPWHALRTPVADLGAALALAAGVLGKVAVDVQTLSRTEIAELAEPTMAGRGSSSAMPHKRNPVLSTLIRSAALQLPGLAAGLQHCLLAEDERSAGAWHAEWQLLREALRLVAGSAHLFVELTEGLQVNPDVMRDNLTLTGSQIVSERVAAHLAPKLGKAEARRLMSAASQQAALAGRTLGDVLREIPTVVDLIAEDELPTLLEPAEYTGAAGSLVDRALMG